MGNLVYKEDWEESKHRFKAFWNRDMADRPLVLCATRRKDIPAGMPPTPPATIEERYTDVDYLLDRFEYQASRTYYGGDYFPHYSPYIGAGSVALYVGSEPGFAEDTIWFDKCLDSLRDPLPSFDVSNRWWQKTLEMTVKGMDRLRGKALVTFPDLVENLDILASLRGAEELLFDLIEYPEEVHKWQRALLDLYFEYYDRLYEIIKEEDGGSSFIAFLVWGPGRTAKLQCDFSAMISPSMFDEFVAPYLEEQAKRLDYVCYHLDGPGALQHVDTLVSLEHIDAIQWTPGAGKPSVGDPLWIPLYRRIRDAGKSLILLDSSPAEAEQIASEIGPEGILFGIDTQSPEQADEVVKSSFGWKKKI